MGDGILLDEADPAAGSTFRVGDAAVNNGGVLHGGIVSALLEVACYLAVLPHLAEEQRHLQEPVQPTSSTLTTRGESAGSVVMLGASPAPGRR